MGERIKAFVIVSACYISAMRTHLAFVLIASMIVAERAEACEVRLRNAVPECPAVTSSPADCSKNLRGKPGDKVTAPGTIHLMSSGHAYYCPSHESCIPLEQISINSCVLTYVPRQNGESPEYLGHIVVDSKQL